MRPAWLRTDRPLSRSLVAALTARRLAAALAVMAGVTVFVLAHEVFPYHTSNHDEAVYLQQAAMLLEGQLTLDPPVVEPFRPWFFVVDGGELYPKYSPVPAAIFAAGELLGGYRVALGVVAAAVVGLTYATVAEAFDRPTGLVAGLLVFASPTFLVEASVFLPYVPTLALNLLFAWAYLRADRTGDRRFAALAGLAVGVAFFARPYTAVLFAAPFVAQALWTIRGFDRPTVRSHAVTAALGLCGVAVTLGYNALLTGAPATFPYEAFAPLDGLGFGYHEIVGYSRVYDLRLALAANARILAQYVTRWSVAAPLGCLLAVVGLGATLAPGGRRDRRRLAVAGLFVSIPLGQLYFWGTVNMLGDLSDPTDGLISFLGPYYHVGLVVPTAAFGAHALVAGWRRYGPLLARLDGRAAVGAGAGLTLVALLASGLAVGAVASPLADNYEVTEQYERAYEPFESAEFENALVLLPTPYGDWLNHPFQALRNDPGYDGDAVYAIQERQFAVLDAFPERTPYRYTYRGEWLPHAGEAVTPRLQEIDVAEGETVRLSVSAGVPRFAESVSLRASTMRNGYAPLRSPGERANLTVTFADGEAVVDSPSIDEAVVLPVDGRETLDLRLFVDYGSAAGFSYDLAAPVEYRNGTYRALTPRTEVCRSPTRCGGEAAYVPGGHREGISLETRFEPPTDGNATTDD
ncbi:MAG: glycosyltransferase family 39 protein [Haloarculaceae archaeon]